MTITGLPRPDADLAVLRAAGTALVLDLAGQAVPRVLHWGADPGPIGDCEDLALATMPPSPVASVDVPVLCRLVPTQADGWVGRPGIAGHRDGRVPHLRLRQVRPADIDHPDPAAWLHGVVSADRRHAVFCLAQLTRTTESVPPRLRLPGLAPDLRYTVTVCPEMGIPTGFPPRHAPWLTRGPVRLTGSVLAGIGLAAPLLDPAHALVLELRAD